MTQTHGNPRPGRTALVLVAASLLLWQVAQALIAGVFGIPGLFEIPFNGLAALPPGHREGGVSAHRKAPSEEGSAERSPDVAALPPGPAPGGSAPPSADELGGWIKAQAREFVGGMDEEGNILYRFDVWLDVPETVKRRIASVDYAFDAPSAKPPSLSSKDGKTGFRVHFGALTCATAVEVKITFDDGAARAVTVDGCEILN